MKRRMICLAGLLLSFCVLLTGCSPAFDTLSEPVVEANANEKFQERGPYISITLPTKSGGTCRAAVRPVVSIGLEEEAAGEALLKDVLWEHPNFLDETEWKMEQMQLVRIRMLVMPLDGADFKADPPVFSLVFGVYNGESFPGGFLGLTRGEDKVPVRNSPLDYSRMFTGQSVGVTPEAGDDFGPCAFFYTPITMIESDKPYYETGIYAILPNQDNLPEDPPYAIGLSGETFADITFADIPAEGKLVWKILE